MKLAGISNFDYKAWQDGQSQKLAITVQAKNIGCAVDLASKTHKRHTDFGKLIFCGCSGKASRYVDSSNGVEWRIRLVTPKEQIL